MACLIKFLLVLIICCQFVPSAVSSTRPKEGQEVDLKNMPIEPRMGPSSMAVLGKQGGLAAFVQSLISPDVQEDKADTLEEEDIVTTDYVIKYFNLDTLEGVNEFEKQHGQSLSEIVKSGELIGIFDRAFVEARKLVLAEEDSTATLNLNHRNLKAVPYEIDRLVALEELDLGYNKIKVLPASIGNLPELRELNLVDNQLKTLPSTIGKLNKLESLWLRNNNLEYLPTQIGGLKSLEILNLSGNVLKSLPVEISGLVKLEDLRLENNQISSLPPTIGDLRALTGLWLMHNNLTLLPTEIGQLKNLDELWLGSNKLRMLPATIMQLKKLKTLDLSNNLLDSFVKEVGGLASLESIDLSKNRLRQIPVNIIELRNTLKFLNMSGNFFDLESGEIDKVRAELKDTEILAGKSQARRLSVRGV